MMGRESMAPIANIRLLSCAALKTKNAAEGMQESLRRIIDRAAGMNQLTS